MELYLMRHGIAEEASRTGKDRDRALTEEGIERTRATGKALVQVGVKFDLILSSPYLRAWQTAEIIANELKCSKLLKRCEPLVSGGSPIAVLSEIKKAGAKHGSILMTGHEPDLSQLISILLSSTTQLAVTMKKGSICKIECGAPDPGSARLEWLMPAKHLCRMA